MPGWRSWVLDNLINVGSTDRGFRTLYGTFGASGAYERRVWDFRLLVELVSPDGEIYLRASDEAINVLVGALDTDVESAQIAAEVKLENLIRRGRLSDAQLAAQQARYRTVQYAETLRRKLEATRRDVRAVDWEGEVPDLIDEALTHIAERYRYENAILTNIAETRDEAEDPVRKHKAAELVEIVSDCIRRHTQLQARLQEAGGDVPCGAGPAAVLRPRATGGRRPLRAPPGPHPRVAGSAGDRPSGCLLRRGVGADASQAASSRAPGGAAPDTTTGQGAPAGRGTRA